jgi:hypothetical protein
MNDDQRLVLQQMISSNNFEDKTQLIRNLKHSEILRNEIDTLIQIKNKYGNDINSENFINESTLECHFLFRYYTDIYNKVKKDEIDLQLLNKFIDILKKIEDGEKDQCEASYEVGNILKEMYIDSALRKAEKLEENSQSKEEYRGPDLNLSWQQFKYLNNKK